MEINFLIATTINLLINLLYTVFALFVGVYALKIIDKKFFKNVDLEAEIQKGNIAAAIFAATLLMFVALIVSSGLKG